MKRTLCIALLLFLAAMAWGQPLWPEEVSVREGQDLHYYGSPAKDSFGNVINAWVKSSNGRHQINTNLYQANGSPLWDIPVLVRQSLMPVKDLVISASSDNCFILAWLETGGQESSRIMMQKVTSSGSLLWGEGINVVTARIQREYDFSIAANNVGGAYIFYIEENGSHILGRSYNATGTEVWGANAPEIITAGQTVFSSIASLPGFGVALHYKSLSANLNYVARYAPEGYQHWQQSYPFDPEESDRPHDIFVRSDHTLADVVLSRSGNATVKVRVFWSDGDPALPQPFELVLANTEGAMVEYAVVSDGLSLHICTAKTSAASNEIRYYWINGSFTNVYPPAGLLMGTHNGAVEYPQISVQEGFVPYCSWMEDNPDARNLMVNMRDENSQAAWGNGMVLASNITRPDKYRIIGCAAGVMAFFQQENLENRKLKMQVLNPQGSPLLNPEGAVVVSARNGKGRTLATHSMSDRAIVFFEDVNGNGDSALCYQLISSAGYAVLPQPVVLTDYQNSNAYIASCEYSDNTVALIYRQGTGRYLQFIDYWGGQGMGQPGMLITSQNCLSYPQSFKLSELNGDLYIGWMETVDYGILRLMGQRWSNWSWQWGVGGKLLVNNIHSLGLRPLCISDGAYYTWRNTDPMDDVDKVYCLLVDANGDPAPGWNASGEIIYTNPQDSEQSPFKAKIYGNDLIMVLGSYAQHPVYALRVNSDHSLPWGQSGIEIFPGGIYAIDIAYQDDNFAFICGHNYEGARPFSFQKVSLSGELYYPAPGLELDSVPNTESILQAKLIAYDNGAYGAIWNKRSSQLGATDLYYQTINPSGVPVYTQPLPTISMAPGTQQYPYATSLGNEAIVVWENFSANNVQDYELVFEGLVAQKISGECTSIPEEPDLPPAALRLSSCYPNPFHEGATLRWEQKDTSPVELSIYNLKGQLVKKLIHEPKSAGSHETLWDGTDIAGKRVSSGIYFIRLKSAKHVVSAKMVKL